MKRKVLIITHSKDNPCVERVAEALREKSVDVYRFDSDLYPVFVRLHASIDQSGREFRSITTPEYELDLAELDAIWYRRLRVGENLGQYMERSYINASIQESQDTLRGALDSLDIFQLDYYLKHRIAANKFQQLQLAQQIGMSIPDTLMGNDHTAARRFYERNREDIIVKMQSSFALYDQQGNEQVVFTNKVDNSLLTDPDALQLCPMKFQVNLKKQRELRITVVSDRLFVAAVDSQKMERARVDWRREGVALLDDWYRYEIPPQLEKQILTLMDRYQLNYGALDFIETPDGALHFLEVNSGGEFYWLDGLFEGQITQAIADTLLGVLPQRRERFPRF